MELDKDTDDMQYPILLHKFRKKLSTIGFNVMFGYPLDMLLPCSAPLATVDHFNGGLLALTSLSKTRRKPEKGHQLRLNKKRKRKSTFRSRNLNKIFPNSPFTHLFLYVQEPENYLIT